MPKVLQPNPTQELLAFIAPGLARRPPSRVVTRRGKIVRGNFPSQKAIGVARFQGLGEERVWKVLEIARAVKSFATHPAAFRIAIDDGDDGFHYTPDCAITMQWHETLLGEVKPDSKFVKPLVHERLRRAWRAFEEEGTQFIVILESDLVWFPELLDLIQIALRNRPWRRNWIECSRAASGVDDETPFDKEAWDRAAIACDELLERVMARNFKQTLKQAHEFVGA